MPKSVATKSGVKKGGKATETKKPANKPKTAAKKTGKGEEARELVYPKPQVRILAGDDALKADHAKKYLGWEEESDQVKFGSTFSAALKSVFGRKIRTVHNQINRPWRNRDIETYCQELLRGHWRLTMNDNIVLGIHGNITNGQTRLAALILAKEKWAETPEDYPAWKTEPTMPVTIAYGGPEDEEALNVMDVGTPRTFADAVYRSPYFDTMPETTRVKAGKMLETAVKLLWDRTGCKTDRTAPRRTHAEGFAFVDAHDRLLECVKHILEENGTEGKIQGLISTGNAAGLMYLMATSKTEAAEWHHARKTREENESMLDFSMWSTASDFWVKIAGLSDDVQPIRDVFEEIRTQNDETISINQKLAVLCNAWQCVLNDEEITPDKLRLIPDEPCPIAGGIDLGEPTTADDEDKEEPDEPSEQEQAEIEERKKKATAKKNGQKKAALVPKRAGDEWAKGDVAWVKDSDGEHYKAEVLDDPWEASDGKMLVMVKDAQDKQWEVKLSDLSLSEPPAPKKPKLVVPAGGKKPQTGKTPDGKFSMNKVYWVWDANGDHWRGRLKEQTGKQCRLLVEQGFQGAGNLRPVHSQHLREAQPSLKDAG